MVTPTVLSFSTTVGAAPAPQSVTIQNGGGTALSWTSSTDDAAITTLPASGSLNGGGETPMQVSVAAQSTTASRTSHIFINAGSAGSVTVTVNINVGTISCQGFLAPFNQTLLLNTHTNRAIPIVAQLFDTTNSPVTPDTLNGAAPPVIDVAYSSGTGPAVDETSWLDPVGQSSSGNVFNFDATTGNWWFNLSSSPYTASGTYTVTMKTGDATKYTLSPTCSGRFTRP